MLLSFHFIHLYYQEMQVFILKLSLQHFKKFLALLAMDKVEILKILYALTDLF